MKNISFTKIFYCLLLATTFWRVGLTLLDTAKIIRYRTLASSVTQQEVKIDSSLLKLKTQIAEKKSMARIISFNLDNQYRPITLYLSVNKTSALANLQP